MPQSFGPYELLELLGRGGMGEVYLARDTQRRRDVALKLLPEHLAADPRFMARFRRESRLAAQLNEPHIIPIHDFGEIDGRLFIDMRLVAGSDLGSTLEERGRLPPAVAVDIVSQVASALDAAHADDLLHRDVKPSNVMLTGLTADLITRPPFAYLVDFGIARSTQQMTALTETSAGAIGTVAYMSPERISGEVGDGRGDVYALACVLYESLTGRQPFPGELVTVIYQHMNADPPRAGEHHPDVPAALDRVIARGMAKDPKDRYASAGDLAFAARQALSGAAGAVAGLGPVPPVRHQSAPRPSPVGRPAGSERTSGAEFPWRTGETPHGPPRRPRPSGAPEQVGSGAAPDQATVTRTDAGSTDAGNTDAGNTDAVRSDTTRVDNAPRPPVARTRIVTMLFAEADGASVLAGLGAAPSSDEHDELGALVRHGLIAHGGLPVIGEHGSSFAVFDAADDALDCARALHLAVGAKPWPAGRPPQLRIGVHTGAVEQRTDGWLGVNVHTAAAMVESAADGQTVISEATRVALSHEPVLLDLGESRPTGVADRVRRYRLGGTEASPAPESSGPPATDRPADAGLPAATSTMLFALLEAPTRPGRVGDLAETAATRRAALRAIWSAHGGVEAGTDAGAILVAFTDASLGVSAAADAQRELARRGLDDLGLSARVGVHTGKLYRRGAGCWGSDVRYVARLATAARSGQVLVSAATRSLVTSHSFESLGRHALEDFPTARTIYHLAVDGISAADFPPPRTLDPPSTNLPLPAGALIGRRAELDDLARRVAGGQCLVALVGPGGSGKTRLAVEAGHRMAARFESVWFVGLDAVSDADEVLPAIARTLGLPDVAAVDPLARLADNLRERRVLLVLDNFEHVLDAAPLVAGLVGAGTGVHILVTSRTPLRVGAEHVVRLGPLAVPARSAGAGDIASVEGVRLLLDRARAAGSTVVLDDRNATDIALLCRRLEGLPLALELAAARLTIIDAAGLARRLGDGADGQDGQDGQDGGDGQDGQDGQDAPGRGGRELADRQRGLRTVLQWTVDLLEPAQRRMLVLLSAFAAGFSPELAESAFGDAIDPLGELVEAGLVVQIDDGRFQVRPQIRLQVRRLAAEPPALDSDPQAGPRAVADALARVAEGFEPRWMLAEGEGRLLLNPEISNILAALNWARDHDADLHLRLAASTAWLLNHSGLNEFSRSHVETALSHAPDSRRRARCLQALGVLATGADGASAGLAAAELWRELGGHDAEAMSLACASDVLSRRDESAAALDAIDRAERIVPATSDPAGIAWLLGLMRAQTLGRSGRHEEASSLVGELFTAVADGSFRHFLAASLAADIALRAGRPAGALPLFGSAMQVLTPFAMSLVELRQADSVAVALFDLGRFEDAVSVFAICEAVHAELSWPLVAALQRYHVRIRDGVPPERLMAARERAKSYSTSEALAWVGRLARNESEPRRARGAR